MKQALINGLLVGSGGFAGSIARYSLSILLQHCSVVMPAGTLAANLTGCFFIGIIAQLAVPSSVLSPESRLLLATGFCGGFTTLSSLAYETAQYLKDGEHLRAVGYLAGTFAGALLLFYLGGFLGKVVLRTTGGIWS